MMLWQIIALWILVPLALFFAFRCLILVLMQAAGPAAMQHIMNPGPSQAWIKQQQQSYRSFNTKPAQKPVSPPVIISQSHLTRRQSAYYQQFAKKQDYS